MFKNYTPQKEEEPDIRTATGATAAADSEVRVAYDQERALWDAFTDGEWSAGHPYCPPTYNGWLES